MRSKYWTKTVTVRYCVSEKQCKLSKMILKITDVVCFIWIFKKMILKLEFRTAPAYYFCLAGNFISASLSSSVIYLIDVLYIVILLCFEGRYFYKSIGLWYKYLLLENKWIFRDMSTVWICFVIRMFFEN